ncbi:MAG TPA: glycosyltransferase family 4 protein [Vicinamibacterales bacterium]|nr:glycosyltransferase family 4 protein [Vicinamibacterales bacterium]
MHILMIAPEPFFEPRGTPFSEYHRIRALLDLGHTVDLVTYPFGADVTMPGLRIFRCLRPPFVRGVRLGPSLAKVPLDLTLAAAAARRAAGGRYDAVHSHEEASAIGVVLARMLRIPHLYDMHSSLPQQLANFSFSRSRVLAALFRAMERFVIRGSRAVIVICPELQALVQTITHDVPAVLIENAPGSGDVGAFDGGSPADVRRNLGLPADAPMVLYTGTFEAYQGLDLLFAAMPAVHAARPDVRLVLAGGDATQIDRARAEVRRLGVEQAVLFAGRRRAEEIPSLLSAAAALVSPRSTGINTPLKIYQYLRSGRPIVATRLLTHTQVLDDSVAFLTDATPDGFARGLLDAVSDTSRAEAIGACARQLADTKYSYDAYLRRTREACALLALPVSSRTAGEPA